MNNEQLNREIETLLTSYINDLLQPREEPTSIPTSIPASIPATRPASGADERLTNRRYYTMMTELIHDYNANIQLYQQNIRDLIQCINNIPPLQTAAPAPAQTPFTTTTTLFSYFLQPTQPAATANTQGLLTEQIEQHTTMVTYNEDMNETRCPICLEDFEIGEQVCKINACGHFFKRTGLMRWFERNTHCPVCRCDVLQPHAQPRTSSSHPTTSSSQPTTSSSQPTTSSSQPTRRAFGPEPPPTTGVPLFTPNRILQQAFVNAQAPIMNEVNAFLRTLGNNMDASLNEVD
jgi:hypothetical protein